MASCRPEGIKSFNGGVLKTLYSAVYDGVYPFQGLAEKSSCVTKPNEMQDMDSGLVIWGGADISPDFYDHKMSRRCAPYSGRRDRVEWDLLQEAIEMEIPIIGVCRGAQMLCAAAGGFLIQDVNNHAGRSHEVKTFDGHTFKVNSIHHQMMVPAAAAHQMIAWSVENVGTPYIYRDDKTFNPAAYGYTEENPWREPEFVYFPKINGYAVQWHPEGMEQDAAATQYILNFIKKKEEELRPSRFWLAEEKKA